MIASMTIPSYLNDQFRAWEKSTGRKQTVSAFARWLGIKQPTLNRSLARKLGPKIYDVAGHPRPDDLFMEAQLEPLAEIILSFPPEKRDRVRELIVKYAVELSKIIDP